MLFALMGLFLPLSCREVQGAESATWTHGNGAPDNTESFHTQALASVEHQLTCIWVK
jgi:hypothetical protein